MPIISSISLLRHHPLLPASPSALLRCLVSSARENPNPNSSFSVRPHIDKNVQKAKESLKSLSLFPSSPRGFESDPYRPLDPSHAVGLVYAAQANFMRVIVQNPVDSGGTELLCVVRAVLKKIGRRVFVGDRVLVGSVDWTDRRGMIENVFERGSVVRDPPVANVDHLMVLFSMDRPKPEVSTMTRFLVEAESTGIPFSLVMNKSELVGEEMLTSWKTRLHAWGYDPLFCSVESKKGLAALECIMKDQTTVLMGPSGVGKSSLINVLRSSQRDSREEEWEKWLETINGTRWFHDQRVGKVSKRSGRGKHTTRDVSLLPLTRGGYLADTPGFNQPSLLNVMKKSLAQAFPEIRQMLMAAQPEKCLFNNCLHLGEQGCIIKGDWERYPYYLQMLDEIKIREEIQLRTLGTKRESSVRYKMGEMGVKQAEPRLEPKKHRRQSRKRINQSLLESMDYDLNEVSDLDIEEGFY
ncbi:hypothetical protein QJS04_geneDACA006079 [Acorus gramineus]|uniref:Uncharacterized protein n=1 Tax=Acorus gramineus TaxID=55184 RepID=A0AAV9B0U0_ACOGR|nr:hypothetical protein QJS04_geneDACA006079 [Acorus gramineus]